MRQTEVKEWRDSDRIPLIGSANAENVRRLKQTDLANHSAIDGDWHFAPEIPPKAVGSPDIRSAEVTELEKHEVRFSSVRALLTEIEANRLPLAMLAMMTLSTLNGTASLSGPEIVVAVVIVWMIALAPVAKKTQPLLSGDVNGEL
jgi:hypothetical protein